MRLRDRAEAFADRLADKTLKPIIDTALEGAQNTVRRLAGNALNAVGVEVIPPQQVLEDAQREFTLAGREVHVAINDGRIVSDDRGRLSVGPEGRAVLQRFIDAGYQWGVASDMPAYRVRLARRSSSGETRAV